jgi:hypothetical protein
MRNAALLAMAFVCIGLLSGCTLARIYAASGNQVAFTQQGGGGEQFKVQKRFIFDYSGGFDIQEVLRERYGSGHEFQNVTVKLKYGGLDVLLNVVTLALANSRTVEVSGDMVH